MTTYRSAKKAQKSRYRSPFAAIQRSPSRFKHNGRTRKSYNLDHTHEESPGFRSRPTPMLWDLGHLDVDPFIDQEAPSFPWEDERTLVMDLIQEPDLEESEDDQVTSLIDALQDSFAKESKTLVEDIATTIVPAVNHIRQMYRLCDEKMDKKFSQGLINYDNACREREKFVIESQDKYGEAYTISQTRIKELFKKLKGAFAERDALWAHLETSMNQHFDPVLEELKNLPAKMERSLAYYDKKAKELSKGPKEDKNKMLKGLLSKLT